MLSVSSASANAAAVVGSSTTTTTRGLTAIHTALDNHQYTKAIKLCQQLLMTINISNSSGGGGSQPSISSSQQQSSSSSSLSNNTVAQQQQQSMVMVVTSLLVHAYARSGQKYKAALTIVSLFRSSSSSSMPNNDSTMAVVVLEELQLYLKYARYERELLQEQQQQQQQPEELLGIDAITSTTATTTTSKKTLSKHQKNKSQPQPPSSVSANGTTTSASASIPTTATGSDDIWDWIDQLSIPPLILPPVTADETESPSSSTLLYRRMICTDETIVSNVAMTLHHTLKLPHAAYQLFWWAFTTIVATTSTTGTTSDHYYDLLQFYGHKTYIFGVGLLPLPQYQHLTTSLLTQLQVVALQLTRLQQQQQQQQQQLSLLGTTTVSTTTTTIHCSLLWAAQTALWKYTLLPPPLDNKNENSDLNNKSHSQQQRMLLLRLAEQMAFKCVELYSRTYEQQLLRLTSEEEEKHNATMNNNTENDEANNNNNTATNEEDMDLYNQIGPTQSYLLYIKTLSLQHKYREIVDYINHRLTLTTTTDTTTTTAATSSTTTTTVTNIPPRQTLLELKVEALQQIVEQQQDETQPSLSSDNNKNDTASERQPSYRHELCTTLEELLLLYPDDWIYWQQYCDAHFCCSSPTTDTIAATQIIDGWTRIEEYRQSILDKFETTTTMPINSTSNDDTDNEHFTETKQYFPYRGPHLVQVELSLRRLLFVSTSDTSTEQHLYPDKNDDTTTQYVIALIESIIHYGNTWSSRASCTYSDLTPYLEQCLHVATLEQIRIVLNWSQTMTRTNCRNDNDYPTKKRQEELRTYIFAVQVQFHILRHHHRTLLPSETNNSNDDDGENELITWEELLRVWKSFQTSDNVDQAQMESRPADELIILAVQRLLYRPSSNQQPTSTPPSALDRMIAATILESAMKYSPYNPHLKICAMHLFGDLGAPKYCWEIYNNLSMKHIQHESCSYLILPILRSYGYFHESVFVCRDILGLHLSSARDVADYVARAMDNANILKAEEFLLFHREKMTKSLTNLEAKGLILDMAPLLLNEYDGILGEQQGIVGADTDFDRVKQMVTEAHNPNGVFSLLQVQGSFNDLVNNLSDNRDFSVLSYEILWKREFDTPEVILSESLRRGHQHNLLIRAALCIEVTKGPKKGKLIKPTLELQKRCLSLLSYADKTDELCDTILSLVCNRPILFVMRELCVVVTALSSGLDGSGEFVLETLLLREEVVCTTLNKAVEFLQVAKTDLMESNEISVSRICLAIADCIVPVFALFEMVAKIADQFGWGKRKKTKRCSAAVADFALLFETWNTEMILFLERTSANVILQSDEIVDSIPNVVDLGVFRKTVNKVSTCREQVHARMILILRYVQSRLALFAAEA